LKLIEFAVKDPQAHTLATFPRCIIGPGVDKCWSIAYVTNDPTGTVFVNNVCFIILDSSNHDQIAARNGIPQEEIISFATTDEMDVFLSENRNTTQGGKNQTY
jgi:hypothetical protein